MDEFRTAAVLDIECDVLDKWLPKLSGNETKVWIRLWQYADGDTGICYKSIRELVNILGMAQPNLSRELKSLEQKGAIQKVPCAYKEVSVVKKNGSCYELKTTVNAYKLTD